MGFSCSKDTGDGDDEGNEFPKSVGWNPSFVPSEGICGTTPCQVGENDYETSLPRHYHAHY